MSAKRAKIIAGLIVLPYIAGALAIIAIALLWGRG